MQSSGGRNVNSGRAALPPPIDPERYAADRPPQIALRIGASPSPQGCIHMPITNIVKEVGMSNSDWDKVYDEADDSTKPIIKALYLATKDIRGALAGVETAIESIPGQP